MSLGRLSSPRSCDSTNVSSGSRTTRDDGALHPAAQAERGGQPGDGERREPAGPDARPRG